MKAYNSYMAVNVKRNRDTVEADFTPMEQVLVVRQNPETHQRESVTMQWGLVPSWGESPKIGIRLIHARAETVATKRAFREAFGSRRCLMAVDEFDLSRGRRKGQKQRFAIRMKDGRPFGVGAIWERWQHDGETIESCAVITTASNDLVRPINDRMPVIIAPEDYDRWLDPEFYDAQQLERMMRASPSEGMVVVPSG